MKQDILCPKCAEAWKQYGLNKEYQDPGDHSKLMKGKLVGNRICDGCYARLSSGAEAFAASGSRYNAPYYKWEQDHLVEPELVGEISG